MAYSESKLANVLFSAELARRLEGNFIINGNFVAVDIFM
jgi:NAD(P)-dependent dehydrogenase (short-subunit alcohol dehydrogenase family)